MVVDINRPIVPNMTEQTTDIAGRFGTAYEGTNFGAKTFEIEVFMEATSEENRVQRMREIANLIIQTADGDEYPLVFSDEEDVTWWVHPLNASDPDRVTSSSPEATFTLSFSCSEAVAYGKKETIALTDAITSFTPKGNAETHAVLMLTAGEELYEIGASNGDGYVYLGAGFDVANQDKPVNKKPRILYDPCNNLTVWNKVSSSASAVTLENGKVIDNADYRSTPDVLRIGQKSGVDFFGTNPGGKGAKGWYGPMIRQNLSKSLTDWEITVRFDYDNNTPRAMNKVELFLLNNEGKRIGMLQVTDNSFSLENIVVAQVGTSSVSGYYRNVYISTRDGQNKITKKNTLPQKSLTFNRTKTATEKKNSKVKGNTISKTIKLNQSNAKNTFTDWYGSLTLKKVGNKYTTSVQKFAYNVGAVGKPVINTWTDSKNQFTAMASKFSGVALYMAKHDVYEDGLEKPVAYKANGMAICDIRVWEILGNEKQLVAEAGDEIIFDGDNRIVYKNGVRHMEDLSIGSTFLDHMPGQENIITLSPPPSDKNKWELTYIPRFN